MVDEDALPPGALARLGDYRFWHGGEPTPVAVSADGKLIASAGKGARMRSEENIVFMWDAASGECRRRIVAPKCPVCQLAFSPDDKFLATGCANTLVVWNHANGRELWRRSSKESLRFVRFSADGQTILAGDVLTAARWKTESGVRLQTWTPWKKKPPPLSNGMSAELSEDAVLSPDGSLLLWKIQTWKADGPNRASGTGAFLRIINIASGDVVGEIHDLPSQPEQIIFAPDSRSLVIGSLNDGMFLWSSTGRLLRRFPKGSMIPLVFSPDGRRLVSTDWEPGIHIWDVRTAEILFSFHGPRDWPYYIKSAVFSPDGKRIVVGMKQRLLVLDARTGRECRVSPGHRGSIHNLVFSADGQILTTVCDATVCRWNTADGKESGRLEQWRRAADKEDILAVSPDGLRFLSQDREKNVHLGDGKTRKTLSALGRKQSVYTARFSSDGRMGLLLARSENDDMHGVCYDLTTGQRLEKIEFPSARQAPIWSRDGRTLAYHAKDGTIRVLDRTTQREQWRLGEPRPERETQDSGGQVVFSPEGDYLAAAPGVHDFENDSHQRARIWHVRSGKELRSISVPLVKGRYGSVAGLALAPAGRFLAMSQQETRSIRLWEVATGQECRRLNGHRDSILCLVFSPAGRTLASGSRDSTALLWDLYAPSKPRKAPLRQKELESLWFDLAGEARRADEAVRVLAATPKQSVPFLRARLHPVAALQPQQVARWLDDLDSDQFEIREKATQALQNLGEGVEAQLKKALTERPSLEVRRRIELLLKRIDEQVLSPESLRELRALACLEYTGTAEARAVVESLSRGGEARLTREAKAALQRLKHRP
jgi:WD40 repeat protein